MTQARVTKNPYKNSMQNQLKTNNNEHSRNFNELPERDEIV